MTRHLDHGSVYYAKSKILHGLRKTIVIGENQQLVKYLKQMKKEATISMTSADPERFLGPSTSLTTSENFKQANGDIPIA